MNSATQTQLDNTSIPSAILPSETAYHRATTSMESLPSALGPRRIGYGLPCVKCKTYYAADLSMCPVCKSEERVSPVVEFRQLAPWGSGNRAARARRCRARGRTRAFLARVQVSGLRFPWLALDPSEIDSNEVWAAAWQAIIRADSKPPPYARPVMRACRSGWTCWRRPCTWTLIEATLVVYEAVWADPSDPSKTYQNAARAVLGELHKRAGISAVLGPHQPRAH